MAGQSLAICQPWLHSCPLLDLVALVLSSGCCELARQDSVAVGAFAVLYECETLDLRIVIFCAHICGSICEVLYLSTGSGGLSYFDGIERLSDSMLLSRVPQALHML